VPTTCRGGEEEILRPAAAAVRLHSAGRQSTAR
jgi:hypothetical protein